ncbi:MAG: FmdE family protein [Spirochaetaceae bacterium]|nr:FmdE family protein [Spirochaetaceae bacterium]
MIELVNSFEEDLNAAVEYHGHLCAGQIIGVRMARLGCAELGIAAPRSYRDLFVFVEVDRCLADAVSVVTGCKIGRRRLKFVDYGKSAAVFADNAAGAAVRISSKRWIKVPENEEPLDYFNIISDAELFRVEQVKIGIPPENLPGPPVEKVLCSLCGEYITDKRHILKEGKAFCKACVYGSYYTITA